MHEIILALVTLMIAATVVGILSSRAKLPYTVSLVVVGIGLKATGMFPHLNLTNDLLMMVFLPALLFEAAIHFPSSELKQFAPTIATLALPSVVLTALATGLLLQVEFSTFGLKGGIGFPYFLLFGTIIAATDPISVITLFRQLGVSRQMSVLVEGESLFNDGTAIVLYTAVLTAITSGAYSVQEGLVALVVISIGGIVVGVILGLFASFLLSLIDDHLLAIAITTVTAYGTYLVAEGFSVSGILATVAAGLVVGNIGKRKGMRASTRMAVVSFWEYISFFCSSIVFLMIGLEVSVNLMLQHAGIIILAFCAVVASRAVSVFLPLPILSKMAQPIDVRRATVVWWAGLRGSLSMVLALSLPDSLAFKDVIIAMTFGVVVLSVIVQGSTMGFLLRALKFVRVRSPAESVLGKQLARLQSIQEQIAEMRRLPLSDVPIAKEMKEELLAQKAEILQEFEVIKNDPQYIEAGKAKMQELKLHLAQVARDSFRRSSERNLVTESEAIELSEQLDR